MLTSLYVGLFSFVLCSFVSPMVALSFVSPQLQINDLSDHTPSGLIDVLFGLPPEVAPAARIPGQVVCLEMVPGNTTGGLSWGGSTRAHASHHCTHLELNPYPGGSLGDS